MPRTSNVTMIGPGEIGTTIAANHVQRGKTQDAVVAAVAAAEQPSSTVIRARDGYRSTASRATVHYLT